MSRDLEGGGTAGRFARVMRRIPGLSRFTDPGKVLLLSGMTVPFALGWVVRLLQIADNPEASPYVSRPFLAVQLPFQVVQLVGHLVLVVLAFLARARGEHRTPWLVHAEIQLWVLCACFSLYTLGPLTTSFAVLLIALPVIGYLIFDARPMHFGLVTMGLGLSAALALPALGVLPYAPFLVAAPFHEGRLNPAWLASIGVPTVAISVIAIVIHASLVQTLKARTKELEALSNTDILTGLANRLAFVRTLAAEVARAHADGGSLCLMMLDADHFKTINDTHGHLAGDQVLARLGGVLREAQRAGDVAARYGGEEFCMLLPRATLTDAEAIALRVAGDVRALTFEGALSSAKVTVSGGVVVLRAGETADALLARADALLYASKHGGRDRMTVEA